MQSSSAVPFSRHLPVLLMTLICTAYSVWVLSLPLFPTQDGPMHLYIAHVLQSVLAHPDGFYAHFYFVRHLLPPYALYYYALMFFSSFLPILVADKVIICIYFFLFAFGFRYLARSIGPGGDFAALLSTLLLFNWPLGMGFINFCLSTSLALWALGLWCRTAGRGGWGRKAAFVLLCYIIMLTHPVPLLAVLAFAGLDLLVRLVRERRLKPLLADAITLLAGSGTLAYVRLFTTQNLTRQVHVSAQPFWRREIELVKGYALLHSLTAFAGRSIVVTVDRLLFYALLAGALAVALRYFRNARRARVWTVAQTWTLGAVLFLLAFPLIPSDLNHSAYFSARLVLYLWIAALAAAAGSSLPGPGMRSGLILVAVGAAVLTLFLAETRIRPIALEIVSFETMPPIPTHSVGLYLHDPAYRFPATTTYDPYFWSGVRMFRRTDSVLWNTPWLDLAIIPLGPRSFMPTSLFSPGDLENPEDLRLALAASPPLRGNMLAHVGVALFNAGRYPAPGGTDALLLPASPSDPQWTCVTRAGYSLCSPAPGNAPFSTETDRKRSDQP